MDFRGHLGGQIALVAQGEHPYNLFRLTDPENGKTYVVRYADGPHLGETNTRVAELTLEGALRLGIRTGGGGILDLMLVCRHVKGQRVRR